MTDSSNNFEKISLQQIADILQVSRVTVSKVINNKPGVSSQTRVAVAKKLVEYGYKKISAELANLAKREPPTALRLESKDIAVIATEPDFSDFWVRMINQISKETTEHGYNFVYHFLTRSQQHNFVLPKTIREKTVCGVIVINVYDDHAIQMLSSTKIPTVFYDLTPKMYLVGVKGDVVLLEGKKTIYRITSSIIQKGKKRLGFIGDISYSKTISDRFKGFQGACRAHGVIIDPLLCLTSGNRGHFYYQNEVTRFVSQLKELPEGFICANDFIAYTLIDYLQKKGHRVPEDIMVSGYDGMIDTTDCGVGLTTVQVDIDALGNRLARQAIMKIETQTNSNEIVYIESDIHYDKSTDC